jgi:hypothetical protein
MRQEEEQLRERLATIEKDKERERRRQEKELRRAERGKEKERERRREEKELERARRHSEQEKAREYDTRSKHETTAAPNNPVYPHRATTGSIRSTKYRPEGRGSVSTPSHCAFVAL